VASLFLTNKMAVQGWVYTGILMALVMCFVSAAYVVINTVRAGVSYTAPFIEGYAAVYRGGSVAWGDNLGLFELIALLAFSSWSLLLTLAGLYTAGDLWSKMEARVIGVKTEGAGGVALDDVQAVKIFTLCMIMGMMAIVGGFSLGDKSYNLITWFDFYADDTHTEGRDKTSNDLDPNGTAAQYDIIYHYVTLAYGYIVFTAITLGGFIFGYNFLEFTGPTECDFDAVDSSAKSEAL